MKKFYKIFLGMTLVLGGAIYTELQPITANASVHYKRTKTTSVKKKTYVPKKKSVYIYKDNKSLKKWTFVKRYNLGDYPKVEWTASKKMSVKMRGAKRTYYWVTNKKKHVAGWAYGANLQASYRRTKDTKIKAKEYFTTNSKAKTYKNNKNYKQWTFIANNTHTSKLPYTWTASKKTYITVKGKKALYYWVKPSKPAVSGWMKASDLKPGKNNQMMAIKEIPNKNMIMAKQGRAYMLSEQKNVIFPLNGIKLSDHDNYTTMKQATIYTKGKPYMYYLVNGVKKAGASGAWVRSDYLKPGYSYKNIEDAIKDSSRVDDYSVQQFLAVLINQYRVSQGAPELQIVENYNADSDKMANSMLNDPNSSVKCVSGNSSLADAQNILRLDQARFNNKLLSVAGKTLYVKNSSEIGDKGPVVTSAFIIQ